MSLVKKNIIANVAGSIWMAFIGFVFIPTYIHFLGVAAWGLIGIFTTLQIVLSLLDLGMGNTVNREMARLSQTNDNGQVMRDLLRTLEWIYWSIALLAGLFVISFSSVIATYWISSTALPVSTLQQSLLLMGIVIGIQLPVGLYTGGLMGLQKQVRLNILTSATGTLRNVGCVLVLWLVSPTLTAFFTWQIISSFINVLFLCWTLWKSLPPPQRKAHFSVPLLKGVWRFAAGVSGISILGIVLSQLDKIVLSKIIPLDEFGYYMLASAISMTIGRLISPVFYSIYPKFTQLASAGDNRELSDFYHRVCQFVSVIILPVAVVLLFFSKDVLFLWTKNQSLSEQSYLIVNFLLCGSAINAIMFPPYALQLAFGWTRLSFYKNVLAVVFMVPAIIYLAKHYGAVGASVAWLCLNLGYFLIEIGFLHSRLLKGEKLRWYLQDVLLPLTVSVSLAGMAKYLVEGLHFETITGILFLGGLLGLITVITAMITPSTRLFMFGKFSQSFIRIRKA